MSVALVTSLGNTAYLSVCDTAIPFSVCLVEMGAPVAQAGLDLILLL